MTLMGKLKNGEWQEIEKTKLPDLTGLIISSRFPRPQDLYLKYLHPSGDPNLRVSHELTTAAA